MKKDSQELEKQLNGQQAAELDEALLDRLEAAAEGTLTELSAEELSFEAELRAIQPRGLNPQLLETLENKVKDIPAPTQVHVLPFSRREQRPQIPQRKQPVWAAAAASVALLGVISAWWLDPMTGDTQPITGNSPKPSTEFASSPSMVPAAIPAEFSRALSDTQDQGIIWGDNQEPHRVLKVTYTDRVSMKRKDGSTYEVEKPRVEYYLVPTDSH